MADENERTLLRKLIDEHCRALAAAPPVEAPDTYGFTAHIDDYDADQLAAAILDDPRFNTLRVPRPQPDDGGPTSATVDGRRIRDMTAGELGLCGRGRRLHAVIPPESDGE